MALKKPQGAPLNKFIRFSGIGIQLGVTIYLAAYLGRRLDAYFGFEKVLTLSLVLVAFVISIYSMLQQLKKMEE